MEEKININASDNLQEIVIRKGDAVPVHVEPAITITGLTIDGPREFLQKPLMYSDLRIGKYGVEPDRVNTNRECIYDLSYIKYSIKGRKIELKYNTKAVDPVTIEGTLKLSSDLSDWDINSGKRMTSLELAQFVRMRRHFFETKDVALKLEKEFQSFKAKVDKEVEANDDRRANVKFSLVQKVTTSMPLEFTILVPVFEGREKTAIKIEIDIDPTDLSCSLVSPSLKEYIDTESEAIINNELQCIKELHPDLRIFQY
jgi:hypothetical protein